MSVLYGVEHTLFPNNIDNLNNMRNLLANQGILRVENPRIRVTAVFQSTNKNILSNKLTYDFLFRSFFSVVN